jgi:hypothetical protein
MTARYIVGDVFDVLATLKAGSIDLVFGSPPFLALRSYLPADHPDKAKEIGSEATPADFLDTLLDVVEACDRVLAPHGSLCFELGDTYSGSGGAGGDYGEGGLRDGQPAFTGSKRQGNPRNDKVQMAAQGIIGTTSGERAQANPGGWPLAKSLCMIPTLFAASLAYGHNMLRPERTTPRWRVRNQIVWARPNPPVGALGDKYRPATSYVTVATKSPSRYFDLDAVRNMNNPDRMDEPSMHNTKSVGAPGSHLASAAGEGNWNPAGAPPLDYWVIPTHPYPGAHYATFPPDLVVKPVKSMSPQRACRVCGEPSRRIVESSYLTEPDDSQRVKLRPNDPEIRGGLDHPPEIGWEREHKTVGWSDCGHDDWRPGCVLDPFAGSGTTLAVATGHGRDAIGIDFDERNAELALDRVGPMFLTVEHHG